MTLAMVNVLPEPVTPIKTCCFRSSLEPAGERLDGLRLVAGGRERADKLKFHGDAPGTGPPTRRQTFSIRFAALAG